MNLDCVLRGKGLTNRLRRTAMRLAMGTELPEIIHVLLYRPELFGRDFSQWTQTVLRGPSEWTVGERELLGAVVSNANRCQFCYTSHHAVASAELGAELVDAVLEDAEAAPISDRLRVAVAFVTRLTLHPNDIMRADIRALTDAGVSAEGIHTLCNICGVFCTINRVADCLEFKVPEAKAVSKQAKMLLKHGYKF